MPATSPSVLTPSPSPSDAPDARRGAVRVSGLVRTFGSGRDAHTVLRGVDLSLRPGEIVAIVGASGCGKSTLLRLLAGLDVPTAGVVAVDGTTVTATDERTAVGFQEPRLLPWRTLAQNVALGVRRGVSARERRDRVDELLDLVGLASSAHKRPSAVSGGMAQRASLARALARTPEVLLLDEPFGALDALTRLRMQDLVLDIHARRPTTIALVTHDVEEALYLADRVIQLRTLDVDPEATSIVRSIDVPGHRPRDRADHTFADLRAELLEGLGVPTHHHTPEEQR
ncbi:ABC transporter ATP-binding protein [Microbacterium koreense]|uniref:ABC transporter ATP-binding protein n=1 Tax=Microbacterium koreense TaxID=323761 RepID=A0ABW2ZSF0_9MICO